MIRCAFFEMKRLPSSVTPRCTSDSISSISDPGSTTTPQPMTQRQPGWRMPEGIVCRTYFSRPTTTVLGMAPTPKEAPRLRQDLRHGQDALGAVREIEREELGGLRARAPDDQDVAHALSARVGDRLLEPAADDVARDRRARGAQPPGERQCRGLVSREVDDEEVGSR